MIDFIADHIHVLNERLEKRGYTLHAEMKVAEEKEENIWFIWFIKSILFCIPVRLLAKGVSFAVCPIASVKRAVHLGSWGFHRNNNSKYKVGNCLLKSY